MNNEFKMIPVPEYAISLTIDSFIAGITSKIYSPETGHGFFGTKEMESNMNIWEYVWSPQAANNMGFTHIHWYNK